MPQKIKSEYKYCLNCNHPMDEENRFCPSCGQARKESALSVWTILKEFVGSIFNYDSRVFSSLRFIFFPSYLTKEFIAGKRRSYMNPVRLFVIMLLLHFTLLTLLYNYADKDFGDTNSRIITSQIALMEKYDSLAQLVVVDSSQQRAIDSMKVKLFSSYYDYQKGGEESSLYFNIGDHKINNYDFLKLSTEELIDKYEIKSFQDKFVLRQFKKANENRKGILGFIIGNMLWGVILLVICISALMKLLYIRHRMYLVEHLIFQVNFHSAVLFIANILIITGFVLTQTKVLLYESEVIEITAFSFLTLIILMLFSGLKKYYRQGVIKTFVKFVIICSAYSLFLVIFFIFVSFLSAMIF